MSSSLVEKLTAEGSGESAGFLNDTVAALWPNINVAISKIIKESVEPIFKSSLPHALSDLHFTKIDLGDKPLKLSNVLSTKTDTNGIKLDMNVDWKGDCDIQLDAELIPAVGVKGVSFNGRLSILLCPLTDVIPLIGAAQICFINPPVLQLDFTGAANIADFSMIDDTIRGQILSIINSMFTLPNRFLVKLDVSTDYFKTYLYPLGIVRLTVEKAWGFAEESKSATKKFFSKITRAAPDCYAKVDVGGEEMWKTSTKSNSTKPAWGETRDFVITDFDQCVKVDVYDQDVNSADQVGLGVTTLREILEAGNKQELVMSRKGEETEGKVSISCEFFKFATEGSSFSAAGHKATASCAFGIKGQREELKPSVVVTWGEKHRFQTVIKADAPGTDISNPEFDQGFRIPVTSDLAGSNPASFGIALLNGEKEMGKVEVPFTDVMNAPDMILENKFEVGDGATIRASIYLRGMAPWNTQAEEAPLPERKK